MDLTMSVFLPACGVSKPEDCLSARDLAELCRMENFSDVFGDLIRKTRHSIKSEVEKRGISTQTEGSAQIELSERLAMIDHAYAMPRFEFSNKSNYREFRLIGKNPPNRQIRKIILSNRQHRTKSV